MKNKKLCEMRLLDLDLASAAKVSGPASRSVAEIMRTAALLVLAVGQAAGFSISRMPAPGLRGRAFGLGPQARAMPVARSGLPWHRRQAARMAAGDPGSADYLNSLSQTVDRTGDAPPQRADAPIRLDGVSAASLTVGIPREVQPGECRVAVSDVRVNVHGPDCHPPAESADETQRTQAKLTPTVRACRPRPSLSKFS